METHTIKVDRARRVHFVGIGGAGMGGLAEVLHGQGCRVSGSDLSPNGVTAALVQRGIVVHEGHTGPQAAGAELIVRSTAIPDDNPELVHARAQTIPILSRGQLLAELMDKQYGIAIAGSHGKTSTTGLIAAICLAAALDPTIVMGGYLNAIGSHARLGKGRLFLAEADESDASFLYMHPQMAVLINLDADHLATYGGDFGRLTESFARFLRRIPPDGHAILCTDDPALRPLGEGLSCAVTRYGFGEEADIRAVEIRPEGIQMRFTVLRTGRAPLPLRLNLPGRHNVLNALAAVSVATALEVPDAAIQTALETFSGIGRRFHILGDAPAGDGKAIVIDDYGHHPREIAATLHAIRESWPGRRLVTVFQPHRYTRTRDLLEEFAAVLCEVSPLLLLDVYPAGEPPLAGIDSRLLAETIRARGGSPHYLEEHTALAAQLRRLLRADDILLFQGAGDISQMAHRFVGTGA